MYQDKRPTDRSARSRRKKDAKAGMLILSLLMIIGIMVGGTLAYLATKTSGIVNTFTPGEVEGEITESFNGTEKTDVNITNTGDVDAYVRIKLVTYRVNENGSRIGGTATIPEFSCGDGWFEKDGYYVYNKPVAPKKSPVANLVDSITLKDKYDDADGGKQVIEVMGEAIQAQPAEAVEGAWGVTVSDDGTLN